MVRQLIEAWREYRNRRNSPVGEWVRISPNTEICNHGDDGERMRDDAD